MTTGIDQDTGHITARLDGGAGGRGGAQGGGAATGREVELAGEFAGFWHGYAGTIYKGQSKTIDHTYLLHSAHWRQASSYVALTRQRESAAIFAATETATDLGQLARQMSRREVRAASVAWATHDELPAELRTGGLRPEPGLQAEAGQGARQKARARAELGQWAEPGQAERTVLEGRPEKAAQGGRRAASREEEAFPVQKKAPPKPRPDMKALGRALRSASGSRPQAEEPPASPAPSVPQWLIAPRVVGPIDPAERSAAVAAAVAADPGVRQEREAFRPYLTGAYRNPQVAEGRLAELVRIQGATSEALRVDAGPEQLGALAGRTGILAGRVAWAARAQAEQVVQAVGDAVRRIGVAEAAAAQGVVAGIEARRAAEATGVPVLSGRAGEAARALGTAVAPGERARAWAALQANERVAGEVTGFVRAVEGRLGADAVR